MSFLARPPASPRLHGLVDRLWRVDAPGGDASPETICPDGTTEIVLHLGDPMRQQRDDGEVDQPRSLLVAQMERPVTIVPTGKISMVGARFVAGALHLMLPVPQDRLTGRILDLESVWAAWTRDVTDRVTAQRTGAGGLDVFERALEELLPDRSPDAAYQSMEHAIATLRATGGKASIDRLARATGLSRRQFERRFSERVGLSPRLFGRIVRFQRAFRHLGVENGAEVAARCGYTDQAHLVREMRRFGGRTPTALTKTEGLTSFFVS